MGGKIADFFGALREVLIARESLGKDRDIVVLTVRGDSSDAQLGQIFDERGVAFILAKNGWLGPRLYLLRSLGDQFVDIG